MRVGVVLAHGGKLNEDAVKFLILSLNQVQKTFEYEFLPPFSDNFTDALNLRGCLNRENTRSELRLFFDRFLIAARKAGKAYRLPAECEPPEALIVVSMATFDDGHYGISEGRAALSAFGQWKNSMAPPSIVEFILTMVVRQSVGFLTPTFNRSRHLGTKGCLFDFTPSLRDVKFKVLQNFICKECRDCLTKDNLPSLADELEAVLSRKWIGRRTETTSVAATVSKLGYDLFITKGPQPTTWESMKKFFSTKGAAEALKIASAIILSALLLWLGLKPR